MPDFVFCIEASGTTVTANAIYFFKPSEMLNYPTDWTRGISALVIGNGSFFSLTLDVKTYGEKGCWMHLAQGVT